MNLTLLTVSGDDDDENMLITVNEIEYQYTEVPLKLQTVLLSQTADNKTNKDIKLHHLDKDPSKQLQHVQHLDHLQWQRSPEQWDGTYQHLSVIKQQ